MIVVMRPDATEGEVDHVVGLIREMGLTDHVIHGTDLTVVAVIGDDRKKDGTKLENAPGVDRVMKVLQKYKMAAREVRDGEMTRVTVGENCVFGGKHVPVVAGPCSVESEEGILDAAVKIKAAGAHALRGGAFKPRTNPYDFQGHGELGLRWLAEAREQTGLPIITEVLTPTEVDLVVEYADCLQIGTRNSQNYKLLEACGKQPKPVLLKRGMAATVEEFLLSAEYVLARGNRNVILCERGIRTFEKYTRNTFDVNAIPLLKRLTHLPVVGDPSHGTGKWYLVAPVALAAVAAGADGLIIEVHPSPDHALSDGFQSLTFENFAALVSRAEAVARAVGRGVPDAAPA
jgi:3-deoxy-7-phosphoheptulonate synthase